MAHLRVIAPEQHVQLLSKNCRNGGDPLATLCPILPAQDLNLGPLASETNALPLDQLMTLILFQ